MMVFCKILGFLFVMIVAAVCASPVDDQPALKCTAPDEVYYKCQLEQCYKTCNDFKSPPPCPSIAAGCYEPACLCGKDYLRNDKGVCVPYEECSMNESANVLMDTF